MWSRIRRSVVSVLHIPAIKRGNWQPLFMIFSFKTSLIWHFQPCLITRGYNSSAPKDCKVMGVWGGSHGRGWHHRAEWELCRIEYWVTGETATEIPILVRMTSPTTTLAYIRWKTIFFLIMASWIPIFVVGMMIQKQLAHILLFGGQRCWHHSLHHRVDNSHSISHAGPKPFLHAELRSGRFFMQVTFGIGRWEIKGWHFMANNLMA